MSKNLSVNVRSSAELGDFPAERLQKGNVMFLFWLARDNEY